MDNLTCRVEIVSFVDSRDGEIQTIKHILPSPLSESLRTLVNFELRKGICVLFASVSADIQ